MTRVYLVRHGATDFLGRAIVGRKPGVALNGQGRAQAERLGRRFQNQGITAIYCSPLDRARETARPIADQLELDIKIAPELNEIDFGAWTGLTLDELAHQPDWRRWNKSRSNSRVPGGETMLEVQARTVGYIEKLGAAVRDAAYILVGHADPIKSALLYFLGTAIAVEVGEQQPRLLFINETVAN